MRNVLLIFVLAFSTTLWAGEGRAKLLDDAAPPPVVAPAPVVQPQPQPMQPQIIVLPAPAQAPVVAPAAPSISATDVERAIETAVNKFKQAQTDRPADPWWKDLISAVIAGALALGTPLIGFIGMKIHQAVEASKLQQADKDAVEALNAGVTSAEQELLDDFKTRNADGSIDDADAAALRAHALQVAKSVGTGPGLKALEKMALPRVRDLIERILLQRKALKATADAPAPASPPATV